MLVGRKSVNSKRSRVQSQQNDDLDLDLGESIKKTKSNRQFQGVQSKVKESIKSAT